MSRAIKLAAAKPARWKHIDPDVCPRCGSAMVTRPHNINQTETTCPCGYSCIDTIGSMASAEDIRQTQPKMVVGRCS